MNTQGNRVIIAGSRNFDNYKLIVETCNNILPSYVEVVSGTARGADKLGEKYAEEKGYPIKKFPADWTLGKSAGYLRNKEMAKYATEAIVFWDGKSKGTKHMIDLANEYKLKLTIVNYEQTDNSTSAQYTFTKEADFPKKKTS